MKRFNINTGLHFSRLDYASCMGYAGYAGGSAIIPMILLLMAEELHFGLTSGGLLHLLRSLVMIAAMSVSWLLAARFGKAGTVGTGILLISGGLFVCSMAGDYRMLLPAIILIGIGNGFFESIVTGLVQDLHREESPGRYINIVHSFWPLGVLLTVTGAGIYLESGGKWRILLIVLALFCILPGVMFFHSGRLRESQVSHLKCRELFSPLKDRRFLLVLMMLFLAGGSEHCFTFWIPSFIELELDGGSAACGSGVALFAAGMFAGRLACGLFRQLKPEVIITGCASICALFSLLIPEITSGFFLQMILLLLGIATGPLWPGLQYCCASMLRQFNTTALYIVMPLFGIPGCGFCAWLLGMIGQYAGLRTGFYIVFFCNLLIVLLIRLLIRLDRNHNKSNDLT